MKLLVSSSIESFKEELKKRIEVLSSSKVTENIDNSNYEEIMQELTTSGISSEENINEENISKIDASKLYKMLILADINQESAKYITSHLNHDFFYSKIVDILKKYIADFKDIGSSQNAMINEKISLYQKYITLLEQEKFNEPFEELDELLKTMSEVGLPDQDKWSILKFIGSANIKTINEVDFNLSLRIEREYQLIKNYLEDEEIKNILSKKFAEEEIDIDTIPTMALELAKILEIDSNIVNNIIVVSLASNMLDKLNKVDKEEYQEEYRIIINDILEFLVPIHKECVYKARKIKEETEEFYNHSLESGIDDEMIYSYLETPLSLIEGENISHERAVELKELSVLKPLYETLATVEYLDKSSPEYEKATNVLSKLVEQYELLESKRETNVQRIN